MKYTYSKKDLLRNPQKYQKTPFIGLDFLKEYQISRSNTMSSLNTGNFSLKNFFDSLTTNFKNNDDFLLTDFFHYLLIMIKNNPHSNLIRKNVDLFLKKFEIKKRLFVKYDSDFNEIDNNCDNLRNYMLLSLLCLIQYEKTLSLKYLNSCLKINDTISSQKIVSQDNVTLFKYIIEKEMKFINQLCDKKGIVL